MTKTATYHTTAVLQVDEFRKDLILWAEGQALDQNVKAAIANRVGVKEIHKAKAESYTMMMVHLRGMEIIA